ncbi:hypothetical protein FACS1894145_6500 [Bacteroidia bacterium]|nr:hypothetical protein FACS1894145_6500 [Bacteroidia bacterium]
MAIFELNGKPLDFDKRYTKMTKHSLPSMEILVWMGAKENIPAHLLDKEDIENLYHIRWQIELIFKQWKSICGPDKLPPVKANRYLCMFYAKMILILLSTAIANAVIAWYYHQNKRLLSLYKCMKTLWNLFQYLVPME